MWRNFTISRLRVLGVYIKKSAPHECGAKLSPAADGRQDEFILLMGSVLLMVLGRNGLLVQIR